MSDRRYLEQGDRPNFVEGWTDVRPYVDRVGLPYLAVQSLCRILDLSHQAIEQLGHSYRGHKVGSAVLAYDESGGRTGIYFGGNYTPHKGAEWNCAEKRAFEVVRAKGFTKVLAIAVSGPPYTDGISSVESPTCQPCHKCRGMIAESDLVAPDTLVATSNLEESTYELHTAESLVALHATGLPQPFPETHPLLFAYWNQILTYDAAAEKAELAVLDSLARTAG